MDAGARTHPHAPRIKSATNLANAAVGAAWRGRAAMRGAGIWVRFSQGRREGLMS